MRQLSSPETICDVAASWALSIWGNKSFTPQGGSGWCVTALTTDHPLFHSYSFFHTFLGVLPSGVPVDLSSWEKLRRGRLVPQTKAPVAVVGLGVPRESSLLCCNIHSRFLLPLASTSCDSCASIVWWCDSGPHPWRSELLVTMSVYCQNRVRDYHETPKSIICMPNISLHIPTVISPTTDVQTQLPLPRR